MSGQNTRHNNNTMKAGGFADVFESGTVQYRVKEIEVGETYSAGEDIDIGADEEIVNTDFIVSGGGDIVRVWIRKEIASE